MHCGLTSRQNESRDLFFVKNKNMAENTEVEIREHLKKGMVDNTEGEVLENLKKVNESLCRVVHMLQGPNSGETSDATKSISSTSLPRSSGPNTSSIFAEHQRLFGNAAVRTNPRVNQIAAALRFRPLSSGTALSTATTGKKRAKKTAGGFGFRTKRNQWTHKFCCLAEKDACRIPSVEDKLKLRAAGLGEREITLDRGWSASLLHEKLSETYPKLRDGGGYEFLRTDGRSTTRLVLIPGSKTEGYSVQYLKDNLNQATAYIRPLQNDLSFTPLEGDGGLIEVSVS